VKTIVYNIIAQDTHLQKVIVFICLSDGWMKNLILWHRSLYAFVCGCGCGCVCVYYGLIRINRESWILCLYKLNIWVIGNGMHHRCMFLLNCPVYGCKAVWNDSRSASTRHTMSTTIHSRPLYAYKSSLATFESIIEDDDNSGRNPNRHFNYQPNELFLYI